MENKICFFDTRNGLASANYYDEFVYRPSMLHVVSKTTPRVKPAKVEIYLSLMQFSLP